MRIGIDARTLSGRFTGDRTYWRGLLSGLSAIDTANEYVLYTRQPIEGDAPSLGANFSWRQIARPRNDALWILTAFPKALKQDRIDVAHTQYNIPLLGAPCPVVTTVHDITFKLFPQLFLPKDRWILNTFVPKSMQRAARVIAVSETTKRDIARTYKKLIPLDKIVAIPNAADPLFRPPDGGQESAREAVKSRFREIDGPYILSVGVLQPRKNLPLLIDAFALVKLAKSPPPHKLVIVGKRGWQNDDLDRTFDELPSEVVRDIVFTGYVADADLPLLYGGAECFCYPSLYEGFGLPPLEAMACGCPVLVSRISSLPEVVDDAGVLLPTKDSDAWAHAIETVIGSETVRERWRERGIARAAKFSWQETARRTLLVYEEARKI